MTLTKNRFYFGPAGDMQILPSFPTGAAPSPTPNLYGVVSRSLTGVPTLVSYGAKRTWALQWIQMTELQALALARLESAYRVGRLSRRTFLLDTRNTNYLSPDASACAAEDPVAAIFQSDTGPVPIRTKTGVFHTDLNGLVDGYLTSLPTTIGSAMQTKRQTGFIPGSSMLFSGYFSGSGSLQLTFFFYTTAGVFSTAVISSTTTVLTGTPTVASFLLAGGSVPANMGSFTVGYKTTTANPTINTNGWMLQMDESTRASTWFPGQGGAEVIVSSFQKTYPRFNMHQIAATLEEV